MHTKLKHANKQHDIYNIYVKFLYSNKYLLHYSSKYNIIHTYKSPQCCVTNNGYHSEFFQISRGIRQGCPISALLFILVVEVMANSIRKNGRIKGIQLNDKTIKISQLADDTTLLVQDIESVKAVLVFFVRF